ncbi:MAG: hypothetical protein EKK47_03840 [Burkholderiales bacterium]|jgi:type IV pilus assembly protein PilX|nr:MAG: hypothetical protein EKK47_03840 [Burkholderiales bacterium]
MLTSFAHKSKRPMPRAGRQDGIVLLMAIIVLVAMTLGALALTRAVYTTNALAGNLAFQQAATHSADAGIEAAVAWLEANNGLASSSTANLCDAAVGSTALTCDQSAQGYIAHRQDPTGSQSWSDFWTSNLVAGGYVKTVSTGNSGNADTAGNTVSYVIQRMCSGAGDAQNTSNDCSVSPNASSSTCAGGSSCDAGHEGLNSTSQVYYRITVRVVGPRNTQSFVQSMVAL